MRVRGAVFGMLILLGAGNAAEPVAPKPQVPAPLFCIGKPDGSAMEFGLAEQASACEAQYVKSFPGPVMVTAGQDDAKKWPFIQPSSLDKWAGSRTHPYTIRFVARAPVPEKLKLVLGVIAVRQRGDLEVAVNGTKATALRLPDRNGGGRGIPTSGEALALEVPLPPGAVKAGENTVTVTLSGGSWVVYDYVLLTEMLPLPPLTARIDLQRKTYTMAGGMGASWHAIRATEPGGRGSAWGANPPIENEKAWEQIRNHALWLGMDWIRVELDQRMYEPERGKFDWDNEEMRTLYLILDWCEANRADVFLTQMWGHVEWNKLPGLTAVESAPNSMEDFAEGLARLADHLLNTKKYTCIRWLCIVNEPGCLWWKGDRSLTEGMRAVRKALDARRIALPLSGPDWTGLPDLNPGQIDFDDAVGAYDIHAYCPMDPLRAGKLARWAAWAHESKKPFFLSEFGNPDLGVGGSDPGPRSYPAVLCNAEAVLRGLAAGVDGFNRWSFLNRGDLDGQWQLVRTWDTKSRRHTEQAEPEPVPYAGYGMLTRLTAKHSDVLAVQTAGGSKDLTLAAALRSPGGNVTVLLLNLAGADCEATVILDGLTAPLTLHLYAISEPELNKPGFALAPGEELTLGPRRLQASVGLPARSIKALTSFRLAPGDPGIIEDRPR